MTFDPIPALQTLGYTEREAAFLYLVAVHSGYFLRRQFDYCIDRNKGSIVVRFLAKAHASGHIETINYKQGWSVYHLCSRAIYRVCGDPESQLRRRKGDAQVRVRLMALDYVLENEEDHFLESEAARVHFFGQVRKVSPALFTDDAGRLHPLLAAFPIALADRQRPVQSSVRFSFIDEGLSDAGKFLRFLDVAEPLLRAIGNFEVVYISTAESNFDAARAALWSRFLKTPVRSPGLFGEVPRTGATPYRAPPQVNWTTVLFRHSYPAFQRSGAKGSGRVRIEEDEGAIK